MGRDQFRTPDEDVATEFNRVCQLFQLALGKPSDRVLFDSLMSEASANGLNWIQGLEYVVLHRDSDERADPRSSGLAKGPASVRFEAGSSSLCKAS